MRYVISPKHRLWSMNSGDVCDYTNDVAQWGIILKLFKHCTYGDILTVCIDFYSLAINICSTCDFENPVVMRHIFNDISSGVTSHVKF